MTRKTLSIVVTLAKIRIAFAVAITTLTGYILYSGAFSSGIIPVVTGIFLLACSASVLNQLQEVESDRLMSRTANRPLPSGLISKQMALFTALALFVSGTILLWLGSGYAAMLVGLSTMVWYNLIYTPLKKITAFAVIPGSVVGALPPLAGWVAAGGSLSDPRALAIGFFFFIGQIPHFWLLILKLGSQYQRANFPTITQLFSEQQTKRLTFIWIVATAISALLFPLYRLQEHQWSLIVLASLSAILVIWFVPLLKQNKIFNVRKSFLVINIYYLIVMVAILVGKL
jgi:protoheme IX farnesyltransferase